MRKIVMLGCVVFAVACSKKDDKAAPAGSAAAGGGGADAQAECDKAYKHLAELNVKKNGGTADEWLSMQKGNIEQCAKKKSKASTDCMLAMTEWDMMKWGDCSKAK